MGIIVDERTDAQRETHTWAVVGTDTFLSGWGGATDGESYAAWATTYDNLDATERMVLARVDMRRVRVVSLKGYRPRAAHTHIYISNAS